MRKTYKHMYSFELHLEGNLVPYPQIDPLIFKILQAWTLWTVNTFGNTTLLTFLCDWMIEWVKVNSVSDCTWSCQSSYGGPVSRGHSWPSETYLPMHKQETVSHISMWEVKRSVTKSVEDVAYILQILILSAGFQIVRTRQKRAVRLLFLVCGAVNSWKGCVLTWQRRGRLKLPYLSRRKAPAFQFKPCFFFFLN